MIGRVRLDHLQWCVEQVLGAGTPGDLMETGVWRGGACILMRAVLAAAGDRERLVWAADSFAGLPRPDGRYPEDASDEHWKRNNILAVPLEEVKAAFARYGLLDGQVRFLPGWFHESLPAAPVQSLALLRLDGDMYGSTMDALVHLYPRLSAGGFLIVDDYGAVPGCRKAVDDYRRAHGVLEALRKIDWTGVWWQKLD
jgi:O-methyltransferase